MLGQLDYLFGGVLLVYLQVFGVQEWVTVVSYVTIFGFLVFVIVYLVWIFSMRQYGMQYYLYVGVFFFC